MTCKVDFSDLANQAGRTLGPTDWMTLDQRRIDLFADATDDHQWIHVDPGKAAKGPYGGTIAHGYLTLALVNKFLPELIKVEGAQLGINYGCNKVRFPSPLRAGARIRGQGRIDEVTPAGEGQQLVITVAIDIENGDKPACVATTVSRFYP